MTDDYEGLEDFEFEAETIDGEPFDIDLEGTSDGVDWKAVLLEPAVPEFAEKPKVAIPVVVILHAILDPATAYWMMAARGVGVEGNPFMAWLFTLGPTAFFGFLAVFTPAWAAFFWWSRDDLWSFSWWPKAVELLTIFGLALVLSNSITALGYGPYFF